MSQDESIRVLHVDDNESDLMVFKHKLRETDPSLTIVWAESAEEALVKLEKEKFDCLLADYEMPGGMNGLKFLQALRAKGIDIPFIYLTGQGNEQIAAEAFRLGACDYYSKNFGFAYFHRIVNSIRQNVRSHRKALEQIKAEELMQQLNQERERILRNMNDVIWSMELDMIGERPSRYTYLSPAIERVTGFPIAEFLESPEFLISRIHPDDVPNFIAAQKTVIQGTPTTFEARFKRKDGRYIWTEARIFPEIDKNGSVHRIQGITSDINAQKEAEISRQVSEKKYKTLFDMAPFVITLTRAKDGKILELNDTILKVTGYTREELIGKKTLDLNLWANPVHRKKLIEGLKNKGFIRGLKTKLRLKNGQVLDVTMDAVPLIFMGEECIMMLVRTAHVSQKEYDEFQKSENRYQFVFSHTIDPILVFDDTGKITDVNHSAARLLGWERFDLLECQINDLLDGDTTGQMNRIIKANDHDDLILAFKRKNGEVFRARIRSSVFETKGISYIQMMMNHADTVCDSASFRDRMAGYMKALKIALEGISLENPEKNSQNILAAIGEASTADSVIWISSAKKEGKSEPGFEEKFSWSSKEDDTGEYSAHSICKQLIHPATPQATQRLAEGQVISVFKQTCTLEERNLLEDCGIGGFTAVPIQSAENEEFIVLVWKNPKTPFVPEEADILRMTAIAIAGAINRKKKENGAAVSIKMLENIVKDSPDIVYIRNTKDQFISVSNRFAAILGKQHGDLIGKPLKDVLPMNTFEKLEQTAKRVKNNKAPSQLILRINEDDIEKVFHIIEFPVNISSSSGDDIVLAGIGREITDLVMQENKVRRINTELDEFVHKVSHDLKAPIRNVIAYIEMAKENESRSDEFLQKAMNQCTKLQLFISKLLELSKSGRTVGNFDKFNANLLVLEVFDIFQNQYPNIEMKIAGILPEIYADRISIMEVFQNLILNALENSDNSKVISYVQVRSESNDKEVVFTVEDNGVGIGQIYLNNIQSSNYSLHEKDYKLHGFGLSISRRIIEAHGGRLWAESTENEGSRFHFTIPVVSKKPDKNES